MKTVKMLLDTAYQGPRKAGDVIEVPDDFASRWAKNGIAEIVETEAEPEVEAEPVTAEPVTEAVDYENMTAKELFALCKERGIEAEPKQSKEYYIEKLA